MFELSEIHPRSRLLNLKDQLYEWIDEKDVLVKELDDLADNLDEHFSRISKAKVGGSAVAIGGGILATVGFGLSFFTFGASLGLSVVGGVIAGAGGATVSGSIITDVVLSRKRRKSAEEILERYRSRVEHLKRECIEIGVLLKRYGNIDEAFPFWICFWSRLVIGGDAEVKKVGWDIIARTVFYSLRVVAYTDDVVVAGARAGATAFKAIGSTAGRGLHIAGGVFGVLLLPLDIYTLVDSALDIHKSSPHKVSDGIRKTTIKMTKECPTKEDVDVMIVETLGYFDLMNWKNEKPDFLPKDV